MSSGILRSYASPYLWAPISASFFGLLRFCECLFRGTCRRKEEGIAIETQWLYLYTIHLTQRL